MKLPDRKKNIEFLHSQKKTIDETVSWLERKTDETYEEFEKIEDCHTDECEEERERLIGAMGCYVNKLGAEGKLIDGYINEIEDTLERDNNMNYLNKTRTYLVGHMQYADGRDWRAHTEEELKPLGIKIFNPYKKPFVKDVDEDEETRTKIARDMEEGHYSDVANRMKRIRSYDLNLVDRSDFIIAHLLPDVASWGSAEEIVTAVRMKKPIFVSMEGGKKKTPLWMMGMLPHHYIYDSIEEVIGMIKKINSGEKEIDSDRWRLLKENLR